MEKLLRSCGGDLLIKEGDLISGIVIDMRPKQLFLDLGIFGTGIVFGREYKNASEVMRGLAAGDEVYGKVVAVENEDGYVELSLKEADRELGWKRAQETHDKDEVVSVKVSGYNRGGLIADIYGLQAFMPVSHLSPEKYPRVGSDQQKILEALRELVGEALSVKIITVNPKNNKLIISERAALEESIKEMVNEYNVGDTIEGVVSGVVDFGAFVRFKDNPDIEGLVHLSELDHRLIDDPHTVVREGEEVTVKVIDIKDTKISLSLKALKDNPWDGVLDTYSEGQEIKGEVAKFNPFGALVKIDNDFQGLIHVSEFGSIEKMKEELELNTPFDFVIQAIKPEEKRIVLVLPGGSRVVESSEEQSEDTNEKAQDDAVQDEQENSGDDASAEEDAEEKAKE